MHVVIFAHDPPPSPDAFPASLAPLEVPASDPPPRHADEHDVQVSAQLTSQLAHWASCVEHILSTQVLQAAGSESCEAEQPAASEVAPLEPLPLEPPPLLPELEEPPSLAVFTLPPPSSPD